MVSFYTACLGFSDVFRMYRKRPLATRVWKLLLHKNFMKVYFIRFEKITYLNSMSVSDWVDQRIKIKRWKVWIFGFNENNTWSVVPAKRNTSYLSKTSMSLQDPLLSSMSGGGFRWVNLWVNAFYWNQKFTASSPRGHLGGLWDPNSLWGPRGPMGWNNSNKVE